MEDFALRKKVSPRAIHRRLLGLWSPFNNSSTVIFNPSATLINVSRRGQRFPVSRNPIPVRLNPERCANSSWLIPLSRRNFLIRAASACRVRLDCISASVPGALTLVHRQLCATQ
jgi:hypothetical protein